MRHLAEAGIATRINYPVPLHLQRFYVSLGYQAGDFPVAEMTAREIVSLPMFPQVTPERQARVVAGVMVFLATVEPVLKLGFAGLGTLSGVLQCNMYIYTSSWGVSADGTPGGEACPALVCRIFHLIAIPARASR